MLNQLNMWNKIGRVIARLSERLDISIERATEIFYTSKTSKDLHDANTGLYLLSDNYLVENVLMELH